MSTPRHMGRARVPDSPNKLQRREPLRGPSHVSSHSADERESDLPASQRVTDYYARASLSVRFYDNLCRNSPSLRGDIDFYLARLGSTPKRVLELGCGTGRVALSLARHGHSVVGVDLAAPMLQRAQAKLKRLPREHADRLRFQRGDLLSLKLSAPFDAVFLPFFVFNHLEGRSKRAQALRTIARHLKQDGFAVIHACSRERLLTPPPPKRPGKIIRFADSRARLEVTWPPPELDQGRRMRTQLVEYQYFSPDGALLESSSERLVYYWFPHAEVEREAFQAGLKVVERWTSFRDDAGREAIYILRRLGTGTDATV